MFNIFIQLLENSLVMSGVIIIMLILSRATRATVSARLRHVCWVVIAVGLLLPVRPVIFTVQMPAVPETARVNIGDAFTLGALPPLLTDDYAAAEVITEAITAEFAYTTTYAKTGQAQAAPYSPVPYSPVPPEHSTVGQPVTNSDQLTLPAAVPSPVPRAITWQQLLLILWAAGALVFLLICGVRHGLFSKNIRRWAQPCTDSAVDEMLNAVCAAVGVRRPRLMICPLVATPLVIGSLRPMLILPRAAVGHTQLRLMLLHEVMHIRRGDNFFRILSLTAVAVHWFNPLVYLMARALQTEAELACDAAVLRCAGDAARKEYGQAIFLTAKHAQRLSSLASAMSGEGKNLKRRLSDILVKKRTRRGLAILCAVIMIGGILLAGMLAYERGGTGDCMYTEIVSWQGDGVVMPDITNGDTPAEPLHVTNPITLEPTDRLVIYLPAGNDLSQSRILETIRVFRRQYPDVEVIVERVGEHQDFEKDFAAYTQRVSAEMMAGGGPDIILTHMLDDIHRTMEGGVFKNLSPLWHRDPDFEAREDMHPAIMDAGLHGNRRYVIPISFNMPLLLGERGVLESVGFPTDAEMDIASLLNAAAAAVPQAAENPLFRMAIFHMYGFSPYYIQGIVPLVDFSQNIALPYEDALRDYIQAFAQPCHWSEIDRHNDFWLGRHIGVDDDFWSGRNVGTLVSEGRVLLYPYMSMSLQILFSYSRMTYLGYEPYITALRNHRGEQHANIVYSAAINANSPNYANAWKFIRLLLTETRQYARIGGREAWGLGGGSPVNMAALNRQIFGMLETGGTIGTAEGALYHPALTEEQKQPLADIFAGITSAELRNPILHDFLMEAMEAYYEGASIDDTMSELGHRLRLYLAE